MGRHAGGAATCPRRRTASRRRRRRRPPQVPGPPLLIPYRLPGSLPVTADNESRLPIMRMRTCAVAPGSAVWHTPFSNKHALGTPDGYRNNSYITRSMRKNMPAAREHQVLAVLSALSRHSWFRVSMGVLQAAHRNVWFWFKALDVTR